MVKAVSKVLETRSTRGTYEVPEDKKQDSDKEYDKQKKSDETSRTDETSKKGEEKAEELCLSLYAKLGGKPLKEGVELPEMEFLSSNEMGDVRGAYFAGDEHNPEKAYLLNYSFS